MHARPDHQHAGPESNLADRRLAKLDGPFLEPRGSNVRAVCGVVKGRKEMGFARATLADHYDRSALVGTYGLDTFENIVRRIGYLEEFARGDLGRATTFSVGQLDRGSLQSLSEEFLA